jgi:hypothetical protein
MSSWRDSARLFFAGAGLFLALAGAVVSHASAQDRADRLAPPVRGPSGWALDVTLATALPTGLGADVRLETPGRFLVDLFVGGNPYADALGSLVRDYGGGEDGRAFVSAVAGSAGVMRLAVGFRLVPDAGLELLCGYTLMYATPTIATSTLEATTGQSFAYTGLSTIPLEVAIHAVSPELGWRFVIADHVVFRVGVGGTFTAGASAHLGVPDAMRQASGAVGTAEHDIASAITRFGFIPEARAALGVRF